MTADDCTSRTVNGAATGFAAGAVAGAVSANWGDVPVVLRNKPWPALKRTGTLPFMQFTLAGLRQVDSGCSHL